MDQLTQNLERLRLSVELQIERILIQQNSAQGHKIPETAFTDSAFPLPQGDEPFVISSPVEPRSVFANTERHDLIMSAAPPADLQPPQLPAVIKRSFFGRVFSRFGF